MPSTGHTVVVVGGGISGLVAARDLARHGDALNVALFESTDRLGGKIRTEIVDGALVEAGADWFVTRIPDGVELCRELGLGDELLAPSVVGASVWTGGRLHPLPTPTVRGVPASPGAVLRSGLLSPAGKARALMDLVLPGRVEGPDVSIGALVRRRLGWEVHEFLVDPMVAASRAGRADELSLAAAAPDLDDIARSHRSLILGARAELRSTPPDGPPFLGLATGMQTLIDQLVLDLKGVEIRLSTPVTGVAERGASLAISTATGEARASGVVLAAPAFAASSILQELSAPAATELRAIEYASGAVIALVYEPGSAPDLPGSGFLVPTIENKVLTAGAWFSRKWAHARHPSNAFVVRAFVGRAADEGPLDPDDETLVGRVDREVREATGIKGALTAERVMRWDKALPQYAVGHLERLRRIRKALEPWPTVALAGAGYWGSGIPDCIRQGHAAAAQIIAALGITRVP